MCKYLIVMTLVTLLLIPSSNSYPWPHGVYEVPDDSMDEFEQPPVSEPSFAGYKQPPGFGNTFGGFDQDELINYILSTGQGKDG